MPGKISSAWAITSSIPSTNSLAICGMAIEILFDDRRHAVVDQVNLGTLRINADDYVSGLCQARSRDGTDIAESEDGDGLTPGRCPAQTCVGRLIQHGAIPLSGAVRQSGAHAFGVTGEKDNGKHKK